MQACENVMCHVKFLLQIASKTFLTWERYVQHMHTHHAHHMHSKLFMFIIFFKSHVLGSWKCILGYFYCICLLFYPTFVTF